MGREPPPNTPRIGVDGTWSGQLASNCVPAPGRFCRESRRHPVIRNRTSLLLSVVFVAGALAQGCEDDDAPTAPAAPTQEIVTVTVSPAADTVAPGDTLRLVAEAFDENAHGIEGARFGWSSSDGSVARVDGSGLVTGVSDGKATITASVGDALGASEITVENPDRAALVALYNATDGANWVSNGNWLTDAPLRAWAGVRTAGERVTELSLEWNNLAGHIPPEIGDLTHLRHLYLYNNDLNGPIPPEVGNLARLTAFELQYNKLTGPLSPEFGNLSHLIYLSLDRNELTGSIPPELGRLSNLEGLALRHNSLTGGIPPELGQLANLKYLDLAFNRLTGPIPPELGQLAKLEVLWLADNRLTGSIPPELGSLSRLENLFLNRNELTGSIPPELGNLTALTILALSSNNLSGEIPGFLLGLPQLESLALAGNPGLCAPDDPAILARLQALDAHPYPCRDPNVRSLPSALMREDGNGMSFALPDDLRDPLAVAVSDPSVVAVSLEDGWLKLSPHGAGFASVELVPDGGGKRAIAEVSVRESVGTFGIDVFVEQPAPLGYAEAMAKAADWWSYILDGTEWPNRAAGCPSWDGFVGKVQAVADELLIGARAEDIQWEGRTVGAYADGCFFPDGEGRAVPALDPGGGYVVARPSNVADQGLLRHEIGHLLGLVSWRSEAGLVTADCRFFTGPQAVEAFRSGGGDTDLPGVPIQTDCGGHWHADIVENELMGPYGGDANSISLGALVDAGYAVDLSKALPWPGNSGAAARAAGDELGQDAVLGEPRVFIEHRPRDLPHR